MITMVQLPPLRILRLANRNRGTRSDITLYKHFQEKRNRLTGCNKHGINYITFVISNYQIQIQQHQEKN